MFDKIKKNIGDLTFKWSSYYTPPIVADTNINYNPWNGFNTLISQDQFNNISTVYICAKIHANTLARLPLEVLITKNLHGKLYQEPDNSDYRQYLLHNKPNGIIDKFHFFNYLELQRNLTGNAFARIYRKYGGDVVSLEIVPAHKVKDYDIIDNQVYYKIESKGKIEIINGYNMLHFRDITGDEHGIWGISPIQILKQSASVAYKALSSTDTAYDNDLRQTLIIKPSLGTNIKDKNAYQELVKQVIESNAGYKNTGGMIVLPSNMDATPLSMQINDALFLATVKFGIGQIASFYGIPPHLVGIFEQAKFNNTEQLQLTFKSDAFDSIAKMYKGELETKLLAKEEILAGKGIEFNLKALAEADHKTRTDILLNEVKAGVRTVNEYRVTESMEPVEGGNELYKFDQFTSLTNLGSDASTN